MQIPGFLGPTYPNRSINFQSDRTINFFPELTPSTTAKTVLALIGVPGMELDITVGDGPIRGTYVANGLMYVVSGSELYSVDTSSTVSASLGTLATTTGAVVIKFNGLATAGVGGNQLAIVDGVNLYVYNVITGVFTTVSLGFAPSSVAYLDGYFIVTRVDSMSAYCSNLYDGLTWNGLATSPISASPENLVGLCSHMQELWMIKKFTTELWYDAGIATSTGFPFARVPGGVLNYGTEAPASIVVGDNSIFMVGCVRNGDQGQFVGIVQSNGTSFSVISPPSINYRIASMTTIADAFGFIFSMEGHTFVVMSFPSGDATYIYDTTTQMWHERSSYSDDPYTTHMWNAIGYSFFNNKKYVGNTHNGKMYMLKSDYYTDDTDPIASVRVAPILFDPQEMDNVFVHRLEVDMETGVGDQGSSLGIDPRAALSISDDGGHVWGNEYTSSIGKKGNYKINPTWRRLGYAKNKVFRLMVSAPVKKVVLNAYAEVSK